MYKMQLCNASTQEVLREETYKNPDFIEGCIESAKNSVGDAYLQQRLFQANYVSHSVINEGVEEGLSNS